MSKPRVKNNKRQKTEPSKLNFELKNIDPLTDNQQIAFESYDQGNNLVLHGYAGTGKAQPLYSKILLDTGWSTIGNVKLGDKVVTAGGNTANIINIFPQGLKSIYKITFFDGRSVECCAEHLWKINHYNWKEEKILNTLEIIDLLKKTSFKDRLKISTITHQKIDDVILPIPPYIMGALLGDGGLTTKIGFTTTDEYIVDNIKALLPEDLQIVKLPSSNYEYTIKRSGIIKESKNSYIEKMRDLDIFGKKSEFKFIPDNYKNSSLSQKIELIRGLMDTDGYASKRDNCIYYSSSSEQLCDDMREILWSMGAIVKKKCKIPKFKYKGLKKEGLPHYTLSIRYLNPADLFSIPRKKNIVTPGQYNGLMIKSVVLMDENKECQCIMIDDDEKLYITDNYIPTHNSFVGIYLALEELLLGKSPRDKIILIRSVVPSRDMGFLPGSIKEKSEVYEDAYRQICNELFGRGDAYDLLKTKGVIQFETTSFLRGLTFRNSIVLVDEIQNLSAGELNTVMTRMGDKSRIIFLGDFRQTDLTRQEDKKGLKDFLAVLERMEKFKYIEFQKEDIVRSELVKSYIITKAEIEDENYG